MTIQKAHKAPKTHKQSKEQKLAKSLGVRASRSQPLRDLGYTDEDVDFFAGKVPRLAKRLELRRSDASFEEMGTFVNENEEGIKEDVAKLKRLIAERDGTIKTASRNKKRCWDSPASPLLTMLLGGLGVPDEFENAPKRKVSPLKTASAEKRLSEKANHKAVTRKPRAPTRNPNLKGVRMASDTTRTRPMDDFKSNISLDSLRTKTWFEYLLRSTSPGAIDQYLQANWLNALVSFLSQNEQPLPAYIYSADEISVPDLKLLFENWLIDQLKSNPGLPGIPNNLYERRYESGLETPTSETLSLFNSFVPGSKAVYEDGLYQLPIWPVLSGDQLACKRFVDKYLGQGGLFLSRDQQFESLIEQLIPYYVIPASESLKRHIESICTDTNFNTDLSMVAHPALEARVESIYSVVENRPANAAYEQFLDDEERIEPSNSRDTFTVDQIAKLPEMVLVAFALLKICTAQRSGPILQLEWLVMGLCCGLYSDLFTEDIQEFILKDIRVNGDLLTQHYEEQGIPIITFDQRWTSYGLY